jgi:hypothetical protein
MIHFTMIILRKVKCIQTNDPQVHEEERKVCTVTAVAEILHANADKLLENHERMGNTKDTVRQLKGTVLRDRFRLC